MAVASMLSENKMDAAMGTLTCGAVNRLAIVDSQQAGTMTSTGMRLRTVGQCGEAGEKITSRALAGTDISRGSTDTGYFQYTDQLLIGGLRNFS